MAVVNYSLPSTSCIIAGIDRTGAHIWVVTDGIPSCHDAFGYAVIGSGQRHADSQMVSGKHSPAKSPPETLVLVHMAKKRAEVTPSVGVATDILTMGPNLGEGGQLEDHLLAKLDDNFAALQMAESSAFSSAVKEFDTFLKALLGKVGGSQASDENQNLQ